MHNLMHVCECMCITFSQKEAEFPAVNVLSKMEEPESLAAGSEPLIDLTSIEQEFIDEAIAESLGDYNKPSCSSSMLVDNSVQTFSHTTVI